MFEKKAREFEWPRERWVGLVADKLNSKGLSAYYRMGLDDLEDYAEFKTAILKAYELLQFDVHGGPQESYGHLCGLLVLPRGDARSDC